MCWNMEASATLAAVGLGTTAYAAYKGEDIRIWTTLGYFSLMEALQDYTYTVIDDCAAPANQIATVLGYLHIAFQPFLINLISLYFIPQHVARKIVMPVFTLVAICTVLYILPIYPFEFVKPCDPGNNVFCSERLCSISGDWHIAWGMPRVEFWYGSSPYIIATFALPIIYGSWRFTLYHFFTGPLLAWFTTGNLNEFAAVWCLYSIGLLLIVAKTPVRKYLHVTRWTFYGKSGSLN